MSESEDDSDSEMDDEGVTTAVSSHPFIVHLAVAVALAHAFLDASEAAREQRELSDLRPQVPQVELLTPVITGDAFAWRMLFSERSYST